LLAHDFITTFDCQTTEHTPTFEELSALTATVSDGAVINNTPDNLNLTTTKYFNPKKDAVTCTSFKVDTKDQYFKNKIKNGSCETFEIIEGVQRYQDQDYIHNDRNWVRLNLVEGSAISLHAYNSTSSLYPRLVDIILPEEYSCQSKNRIAHEPINLENWKAKQGLLMQNFVNGNQVISEGNSIAIDLELKLFDSPMESFKYQFKVDHNLTRLEVIDLIVDKIYEKYGKGDEFVFFTEKFKKDTIYLSKLTPKSKSEFVATVVCIETNFEEDTKNDSKSEKITQ
jgi:hypothetical protein